MGTRGLTGFVLDNQIKASYQQFDSYPTGVGLTVLSFARGLTDLVDLRRQVSKLKVVPEQGKPTKAQRDALTKRAGITVEEGEDWYWALRSTQGQPARILESGYILDSADFGKDSLFCEWAYLINTDDSTLEVYEGFQEEPHSAGRWALPEGVTPEPSYEGGASYYPVKLVATFRLSALPSDEDWEAYWERHEAQQEAEANESLALDS